MSRFQDELTPAPELTWWDTFEENRDLPMAPQLRNWTCSICALDWLLIATGLDPWSTREKVAQAIGYPGCVDEWSGLKDIECLTRVIESYGVPAVTEWVGWDRAVDLARSTATILNSTSWYHFASGRGLTQSGDIWIANSAPGYRGIYDVLTEADWNRLPGWRVVYLVH